MTETSTSPDGDPPPPTFDVLPLSDEVRRALVDMDYQNPTPVQTAVWEPAAEGKDIVVQARTGTGKTTAFGLPIVDRIARPDERAPQALYVIGVGALQNDLPTTAVSALARIREHYPDHRPLAVLVIRNFLPDN